jgi:hypothetical protein
MVMMVYLFHLHDSCREMMVYLFHRYSSGYGREANYDGLSFSSPRLVVTLYSPRWSTFSIFAIETHDLKTWTLSSTFSPASTSFLSEEECDETK